MASKIKTGEWTILYVIAGIIDLIQFFGDLLLTEAAFVPEAGSAIADPFIGLAIGGYLQWRGVDMIKQPKRILSLVGVTGLEELTGGIAPAWIIDIWYIHKTVKMDDAQLEAQRGQEIGQMREFYNKDGRRAPDIERSSVQTEADPLYKNGVRRITKAKI